MVKSEEEAGEAILKDHCIAFAEDLAIEDKDPLQPQITLGMPAGPGLGGNAVEYAKYDWGFYGEVQLAGGHHYDGLEHIDKLTMGQIVILKPEHDNPYDYNAVSVFLTDDIKLGYVAKEQNQELHKLINSGVKIRARISHYESLNYGGMWIQVKYKDDQEVVDADT